MQPPVAGEPLTSDEFDEIMDVVHQRMQNFPKEPPMVAMWTVISNVGDRFSPVECEGGEWSGLKQDIPKSDDGPKCPQGHSVDQTGPRLSIGWIEDSGVQTQHRV